MTFIDVTEADLVEARRLTTEAARQGSIDVYTTCCLMAVAGRRVFPTLAKWAVASFETSDPEQRRVYTVREVDREDVQHLILRFDHREDDAIRAKLPFRFAVMPNS